MANGSVTSNAQSGPNAMKSLAMMLCAALILFTAQASHLCAETIPSDELKSLQKSSVIFKSRGGVKYPGLRLERSDVGWWEDAKFGMFIHWGLYSIPARGEWVMHNQQIPSEEYAKLAAEFVPQHFDAGQWAHIAKEAGMKYMVLTARHHDGFALWDSPSSHGNFCAGKTAAKRDFVAEYTQACREAGLGVGLYYSPMDWRFPGYFRPKELAKNAALMKKQCYGQVEELMSRYGKIDILWYDGGWLSHNGTDADAAWFWEPVKLNLMVRKYQPSIVINPRSGWEGDFQCDEGGHNITGPIINDVPWEKCLNLNQTSWGFNTTQRLMSAEDVIKMLVNVVGRGGNVLLNVGPDRDGVIPPSHVEILMQVGVWLKKHGESIYGTRPGPFQPVDGRYCCTSKGDAIYVHVLDRSQEMTLPPLARQIECASLLSNNTEVPFTQSSDQINLTIPSEKPDGPCAVVKLTLKRPAK
jgi:alpha-L-fucosidase